MQILKCFIKTSINKKHISFLMSHLDNGGIIYSQTYNVSFLQNLESIQCNSAPAITGAIRGPSREKPYHELGFESRRSYHKLCCIHEFFKSQSLTFDVIPQLQDPIFIQMMISYVGK